MLKTYSIAYRTPYLSDCIQPPVLAEAVAAAARGEGGDAFLAEVLPAGAPRTSTGCDRVRDPDRDGLIATLQPDESGLDHTPKYDALPRHHGHRPRGLHRGLGARGRPLRRGRPRPRADVRPRPLRGRGRARQHDLRREPARAGRPPGAQRATRRARRRCARRAAAHDRGAGREVLRPRGAASSSTSRAGARSTSRVNTVSCLLPLALPDLPALRGGRAGRPPRGPARVRGAVPRAVGGHERAVASRPASSGTKLVWRGPIWMNTNWYSRRGLRRHGRADLARHIEDRSAALVEKSGFREYYDPLTGEGNGALDFSWTALVLDMLARLESERAAGSPAPCARSGRCPRHGGGAARRPLREEAAWHGRQGPLHAAGPRGRPLPVRALRRARGRHPPDLRATRTTARAAPT